MNLRPKTELINFNDIKYPETLYKYRDWNKPNNRTIISKREVFFSPPSNFDDEFDCKIPRRWDLLSDEDILNWFYYDSVNKQNPNFSIEQHIEFAVYWANNTAIKDKAFIDTMQSKEFGDFSERCGVLSLTEFNALPEMWQSYSANHTGFCVGFEPEIMLRHAGTGGGKVMYDDELPIIYPTPKHSTHEQLAYQIFSKLSCWEFEQEYRVFKFREHPLTLADRQVQIPAEAFKELIFGANMIEETIRDVIESIPHEINHIRLKRAYIESDVIIIKDYDEG